MRFRCQKRWERGHVPGVDSKQAVLYGDPCLDICHRSSNPEDSGQSADDLKSAGTDPADLSIIQREGGCCSDHGRNGGGSSFLSGQQGYEGGNRVWRQLDDFDTWNLSWSVGTPGSAVLRLPFACGGLCGLSVGEEDVRRIYASICTISGGGVSAANRF